MKIRVYFAGGGSVDGVVQNARDAETLRDLLKGGPPSTLKWCTGLMDEQGVPLIVNLGHAEIIRELAE